MFHVSMIMHNNFDHALGIIPTTDFPRTLKARVWMFLACTEAYLYVRLLVGLLVGRLCNRLLLLLTGGQADIYGLVEGGQRRTDLMSEIMTFWGWSVDPSVCLSIRRSLLRKIQTPETLTEFARVIRSN